LNYVAPDYPGSSYTEFDYGQGGGFYRDFQCFIGTIISSFLICLAYAQIKSKTTRLGNDMLATTLLYSTILTGVIAISLKAGWICFNPFVCIAISIMASANFWVYPNSYV
jgi:hypothetical protein